MPHTIPENSNVHVIQIQNLLNEIDNNDLLKALDERFRVHQSKLIIDLSEVKYINSIGINFLVSLASKARKHKTYLALTNINEQIHKILRTTKLLTVFNITTSVEEALQYLEHNF